MTKNFFYILPTYNESLNLNKLLINFKKFFKNKKITAIIVIVDDGSTDNSADIIKKFIKKNATKKFTIKILKHKKNLGLGRALKTGFEHCFSIGNNDDIFEADAKNFSWNINRNWIHLKVEKFIFLLINFYLNLFKLLINNSIKFLVKLIIYKKIS